MKAKVLATIVLLCTIVSSALSQTSEHLTFKGIPIDGTLTGFVSKMKLNGFTHDGTVDGTAVLSGDFAGYKGCYVGVSTLKQKDLVYKLAVMFPEKETWTTLSNDYFHLKEMLTEKYGEPIVVEKFDTYSGSTNDDNMKMHYVRYDKCKYFAVYETPKGTVELSIEHSEDSRCFVKLMYFDKINGDIIKSNAKDDL